MGASLCCPTRALVDVSVDREKQVLGSGKFLRLRYALEPHRQLLEKSVKDDSLDSWLDTSLFFKGIKPPAQPLALTRMSHKLWRWYGPGRVLATETRTDALWEEREPSHVIWIVSHGRLKRCAPEQLRHASREQLLTEGSESTSAKK